MKQARFVPSLKDGETYGVKVYAIRRGSLFEALGLENGDLIQRLNGHDLTRPDKALEAVGKLRDAPKLVLELRRRGAPMKLTYRFVE